MAASDIEWTDKVWNPVRGCSLVSQGCKNCYAMRQARRMSGLGQPYEGLTVLNATGPTWTGKVVCDESKLDEPLHWKKPRRIFVNSMSDLFHEDVPFEFIDKVFTVMALCPQHTFQILTKRPEQILKYFEKLKEVADDWAPNTKSGKFTPSDVLNLRHVARHTIDGRMYAPLYAPSFPHHPWPLPNAWLGVSVEDQKTADERIPLLLQTPAVVRWVSYEPALGPIAIQHFMSRDREHHSERTGIDWLVGGGESGPGARPMHPDWARSGRDQCVAAGIPFFFKQWGEWIPSEAGKPSQLPPDHGIPGHSIPPERVRWLERDGSTIPVGNGGKLTHSIIATRVGKKAAGRLLDGREWNEYPKLATGN